MSSTTVDQSSEEVAVDIQLPETSHYTLFTVGVTYVLWCINSICNLAATCGGLVTPLGSLWANYDMRRAFGAEGATMPTFGFIITCLLGFVEIKAQGDAKFPFETHPGAIMVSVTSVLVYGFASAAELVISCARIDPNSVYAIVASFGRFACLCVLVASLASLFYL